MNREYNNICGKSNIQTTDNKAYTLDMLGFSIDDIVINIMKNHTDSNVVTLDSHLKYDLGLDSLSLLEVYVEIEDALNMKFIDTLISVDTVRDITLHIESSDMNQNGPNYNINNYPLKKTRKHLIRLKRLMFLSRVIWYFEISGRDNVPVDGRYILCPNHQSHFDSLWVWTAIGAKRVDLQKICCLAKQEHLDNNNSREGLIMLGGIPVDRKGNTAPAMLRALECLHNGYSLLIHPEGTRTLNGKINEFKGGAAKLAIDANVPLVPVRIEGAWKVFPPHRKRPRIFSWKGSYPLSISFGKPIMPNGRSVEELTAALQSEVERLGDTI